MFNLIDRNIEYLQQLTKEESDFIEHILNWPDDQVTAFRMAKHIFEECLDADKS